MFFIVVKFSYKRTKRITIEKELAAVKVNFLLS